MPSRRLLALLVLPVVALGGAGCGGSNDPPKDRAAPGLPGETTTTSILVQGGTNVTSPFNLGSGQGPPAGVACGPVPPAAAPFDWLPPDLPLPVGSHPVQESDVAPGTVTGPYHRGIVAVRGSIIDFVRFALGEWPKAGWALGRGESEPGEAEDGFSKGDVVGAFRIRAAYCDSKWSQLLLVVGTRQPPPTAPPSTSPTTSP